MSEAICFAKRLDDWPKRLHAAIDASRKKSFKWGETDCLHFAADCALAITGVDPLAGFRGLTERQALRELSRRGGFSQIMDSRAPIDVKLAQRGDVVMTMTEDGEALGVCVGDRCAFVARSGLTFMPMTKCIQAWRV